MITISSATAETARDADVGAHSVSLHESNVSPAYNLRPLNSPTHYLVIYLFISICVNDASPRLHIHTSSLFQVKLEKTAGSRWTCFGVRGPGHWTIQP